MPYDELSSRIKSSLDITDIIGERVRLRKTSRGYMGLCPFHNEKTPSFHVYSDTQSYYCFSCHEAGDIFTFIMKTENLNFREALEFLAERAGIDTGEYNHGNGNREKRDIHDVISKAADFFIRNLQGSQGMAAREYMKRRNLNEADMSNFSLGYALNSWDSLVSYLRKNGINDREIISSGLAVENSRGLYDRFRGRLIFPVKDISGRFIAFGGRLIDGEGAKYINSPESSIYMKRRNLYLLDRAGRSMREKGRSILCEGYMDALRLHKCGFTESVASLGTSLTGEQAELLKRFSDRCIICYDNDSAGQRASLRGMYILAEHGLNVYVLTLPEGKDPDEYLSANSPESFENLLKSAKPLVVYHIDYLRASLDDPSKRKSALKELIEDLSRLEPDEVLQYKSQLSSAMMITPDKVENIIRSGKKNITASTVISAEKNNNNFNNDNELYTMEAGFCSMLMKSRKCRLSVEVNELPLILENEEAREIARAVLTENPENLRSLWLSTGDTEKMSFISQGEFFMSHTIGDDDFEKWKKIYRDLKAKRLTRRINEVMKKMKSNTACMKELQELTFLQKELEKLNVNG